MTVHIVGAGMAGLSAAFFLSGKNVPVVLYEASGRTGGRCHSFEDKTLGATVDSGTHLMLGSNTALLKMLEQCPSETPLLPVGHDFLFYDVSNRRFFNADLRTPLSFTGHCRALYPLFAESVMNTPAAEADFLMLMKTGLMCLGKQNGTVYLASPSLKASVVDPVERELKRRGMLFRFARKAIGVKPDKILFHDGETALSPNDKVILTVPLEKNSRLPENTIAGIHYKTPAKLLENRRFIGMVNATGHWVFERGGVLSVTISAADGLLKDFSPEEIARNVWKELSPVLCEYRESPLPPYRFIASKRATLHQSRLVNSLRPSTETDCPNVFNAGAAVKTGLPCTIEGAVRSGIAAAQKAL